MNDESITVVNGKEVYAFTVLNQGSYKIPGYNGNIIIGKGSNSSDGVPATGGMDDDIGTFSDDCVVLYPGVTYYYIGEKDKTYEYSLASKNIQTENINADQTDKKTEDLFETIERLLADFILSIAKVVNWLIGKVVGRQITLDDIIFNKFSDTKIDFFTTDIFGNEVESESSLIMDLRAPVTAMYNFFKNLVLVGYMIILVYIGAKMMLDSTTAKKKATYKETFMYWVTGIIILFFMPYFMKYVIALDEAIVTYISDDSGIRSQNSREGELNASQMNTEANKGFLKTDFDSVIDYSGKDYMSSIGKLAAENHKLGYSIAFLILTWQIITMLIYYYKRIFVTALLIMIFPLIAFTFAWDKLNDGRSQALSMWTREFTITVFVQAFHAIVYVFITNTIYATIQTTSDGNAINADFILLIIASSFMFAGEDILKKMFGGGGEALGSATQSAAKIALITKGTVGMGTRAIRNTVGKDGAVRKTVRSFNEARTYGFLASRPGGEGTPSRMELIATQQEHHRGVGAYLPSEGEITPTLNEAAEMLYGLNNSSNPKDFANAYKQYQQLMNARNGIGVRKMTDYERNQFDQMMQRSNIDLAQLDRLEKAMENAAVATMAISGEIYADSNRNRMSQIIQNLRIEIEAIFPATDGEGNKLTGKNNIVANKVMNATLIYMAENGISSNTKPRNYEKEWETKLEETKEVAQRIGYKTNVVIDIKGSIQRKRNITDNIMTEYSTRYLTMTPQEMKNARNIAIQVATVKQMYDSDASAYQIAKAYTVMEADEESKKIAREMMEIAGIDTDSDTIKYIITKDINTKYSANDGRRQGIEGGTLFNTSRNQVIDDYFTERKDEIYHQFRNNSGPLSKSEEREAELFAYHLARVEQYDMGLVDSSVINDSMQILGTNEALADRMMEYVGIDSNYDTLKKETGNLMNVVDWAKDTVTEMELESTLRKDENPYVTILDIIESAKKGRLNGEDEKIGSVRDMLNRAAREGANTDIIERKKDTANKLNRIRMQALSAAAMGLGVYALEEEGYNTNPAVTPTKEKSIDGLTRKDMQEIAKESGLSTVTGILGIATDALVTPVTTMTGFAIGAAVTDDFMPLEESMLGAISGNKASEQANKLVGTLSSEKERQEKLKKIKQQAGIRVKGEERDRLIERQAFEDAKYEARDGKDGSLVFTGANATMHIEADGTLSATVNVMAENAAFISVSEEAPIPSSGWQAYQENIYYQFNDNSPATPHTLYIYVRDRSGNILGKRISEIHL